MYTLRLDKETCNKIAEALVLRWTEKPEDLKKVIDKYYELDHSWSKVVDHLTAEIYDTVRGCSDQSFSELLETIFPHIEAHLHELWYWYKKENQEDQFPSRDWFPSNSRFMPSHALHYS